MSKNSEKIDYVLDDVVAEWPNMTEAQRRNHPIRAVVEMRLRELEGKVLTGEAAEDLIERMSDQDPTPEP